jgi:hypothetical protein
VLRVIIIISTNKLHIQLRSENDPLPRRVGTSAAFGGFPVLMPGDREALFNNNCFKSFTR